MQQYAQSSDRNQQDVRELTIDEILAIAGAGSTDFPIIHR
jgi:hypothetical protein